MINCLKNTLRRHPYKFIAVSMAMFFLSSCGGSGGRSGDTPMIAEIEDQVILENTSSQAISLSINDVDTDDQDLSVIVESDNSSLLNSDSFSLDLAAQERALVISPLQDASGIASVNIRVIDEDSNEASTDFTVTVIGNVEDSFLSFSRELFAIEAETNPMDARELNVDEEILELGDNENTGDFDDLF